MAAAMTSIVVAADAWTAVYTAESGVTIGLWNRNDLNMLIRVDANASTSDDPESRGRRTARKRLPHLCARQR